MIQLAFDHCGGCQGEQHQNLARLEVTQSLGLPLAWVVGSSNVSAKEPKPGHEQN